jgi:hypothetical protein
MLTPETWRSWDEKKEKEAVLGSLYTEDKQTGISGHDRLSLFRVMIRLVQNSITQLCDSKLKELLEYFQVLVSEKSALFDPNLHDSLLSDNETFSRSKTYFWSINMLREIEISISRNINQVEGCIRDWPRTNSSEEDEAYRVLRAEEQLRPTVEKLSAMKDKFKTLREEAQALRDGVSDFRTPKLKSRPITPPPRHRTY